MKRLLPAISLIAFAVAASACVGYPKIFLVGRRGDIPASSNAASVKLSIVRSCEGQAESSETVEKSAESALDAQGRFKITIAGLAWDWFNFLDGSYCRSRAQLYSCGNACLPVAQP